MAGADLALLTIVWATGAGLLAQLLAHRLRIPAIVPLLAVGVLLGPSGLDVVHPAALGGGLAVILFDGALNLGVVVTWTAATLVSRFIAERSWRWTREATEALLDASPSLGGQGAAPA